MPERSAQSVRADADAAATQDANDAAANANASASDADSAAGSANKAAERHLQIVDVFTDSFGNQRLRVAVGEGLQPQTKTTTFLGETFESLVSITYPA